jgi:hypothetical protein
MRFSESFFAERFALTEHDLESYLSEALHEGGVPSASTKASSRAPRKA